MLRSNDPIRKELETPATFRNVGKDPSRRSSSKRRKPSLILSRCCFVEETSSLFVCSGSLSNFVIKIKDQIFLLDLNFSDTSCPIEFLESVDRIIEPVDYMKVLHFSTEYVDVEDSEKPRFGGYQTLEERESSFYARNARVHCGFIKGPDGLASTGFNLSEKDKNYLNSCKVAVSSCIFGSSDFLRRPTRSKVFSCAFGLNPNFISAILDLGIRSLPLYDFLCKTFVSRRIFITGQLGEE